MRLAIDGYEANTAARVGIGRYASEVVSSMYARIKKGNTDIDEVVVYLPEKRRPHMPPPDSFWKYDVVSPKHFWTFWALPNALRSAQPSFDVVFSPTHYIPRFIRRPKVMAIMDVSYLVYPELFRPQDLHKLTHWTAYSARHAAAVITISQFSKNAIIEAYRVPPSRVTVAYPALPKVLGSTIMTKRKNSFPKRYILSVGTLQPRKNYVRLIEAFATLDEPDLTLCIAGKKGWLYDDILAAPAKYGVADRVKFMDFVADADLPGLYSNAECFALPSLYEGFGLPVLEAMTYGVPVVVSNSSSLPEIAGEAGIYVDPAHVTSIAEGLSKALAEKGTVAGNKRVAIGKKHAATFTWDAAAAQVLEVITRVGKKGSA